MGIGLVKFPIHACVVVCCMALSACPLTSEQMRPESKNLVTEILFQPNEPGKTIKLRLHPGYVVDLVGWWEPLMPKDRGGRPEPGEPDSHVWLWMLWPNLEYRSFENTPMFMNPLEARLTILVSGMKGVRVRSGEFTVESRLNSRLKDALERALHPPGPVDLPMSEFSERYGLRVFGAARDKANPSSLWPLMEQIHIPSGSTTESERSRFIGCVHEGVPEPKDAPGSGYVPRCSHFFVSPSLGALVKIDYRRKYLPQWNDIEIKVEAKLKSFVVEQR